MRPDVIDLNEFYSTPLGQVTRRAIRRRIREIWPDTKGLSVLGFGYASPFLLPFREEAERVIALMPAQQGIVHWPSRHANLVALAEETDLPLPDASVDRVLMVHALETSEQVRPMMREIWRVMASGGRLIVVVPNRRGIWARVERTPFGHGSPFSPPQMTRLLRETLFSPRVTERALFFPPTRWRTLLRVAPVFESVGQRWGPTFSGVLVVEAGKQIYAMTAQPEVRRTRRRARAVLAPEGSRRGV